VKITVQKETAPQAVEQAPAVHPLKRTYRFVSKKDVDYHNLTAFEAISMTAVFLLAITTGVVYSLPLS
jgi:hypothetical protein